MTKRIAILGSTGSIGCNALEVIEHLGPPYRVAALSGHRQADKLLAQVRRHKPAAVALSDGAIPPAVESELAGEGVQVYHGAAGLIDLVQRDDIDIVVAAIVGAAGLPAVLAAVQARKQLALANKESLVMAGSLLVAEARRAGVHILPVDSEHSAIFQAMRTGRRAEVARVVLTASGGPFRGAHRRDLANVTVADAMNHPTWRMGTKTTIDSATMFNKALEVIEACWLFDLPPEMVEVVVHPESVVHSMVEFVDGSVMAQLSPPDMRTPIQYAITYPERAAGISRRMSFDERFSLNFEAPDADTFPALRLAYEAIRAGGTMGAVLNAANEAAVTAFVAGNVGFLEISRLVELTMSLHCVQAAPSLDDLLEADRWARRTVEEQVGGRAETAGVVDGQN